MTLKLDILSCVLLNHGRCPQCCTCITKIMMDMDGDGVDCENFQRKARALERYRAVIPNLEKHAEKHEVNFFLTVS